MTRLIGLLVLNVLASFCSVTIAKEPADTEPIAIGLRRELFVDQYLIDTMHDVRLEIQRPQPQEIVTTSRRSSMRIPNARRTLATRPSGLARVDCSRMDRPMVSNGVVCRVRLS
jgi:hypothetical protein